MLSTLHTRDDSEAQTSFGLIGQNKTKQTNNFTPMEYKRSEFPVLQLQSADEGG